ncbi:peptidase M23 [Fructilactobacillus sanfranciscensis]|uniref:aggregation-promoting factor n=2 Tax=Fructilactobacillus sanfranciscensis TaxID=1625 RepID=UPI000CD491DF|nr:LysM domain-containing protein [Fructilactobacillus sanfranciscensis]MDN4461741.1 LysM peptidoglycan-binding domain-containing protein [Fructilactobacillus sanfranciscensis]NDR61124.1 LysM peptidoglycan-binding domain-containing protein [Fructilactobacillus sanfranciscensis]POH09394.1 peptidase M23 [Fructilactobacillus sanfranciscensis]POH12519.1 peptidase M23 [Fructilactobacillus sanfranciscensis]POH16397.1 peptidase M23 [Fructilactobacillus sanfranciscensis]
MKKRNMIKSIATFAAVSAGVLFAGSQSASASTVKHTVVSGDTLNKLSAQYGVSVQDLAQANKIQDINKIYVGEVFTISDDGQISVSDQSAVAAAPAQAATTQVSAPVQQAAPVAQAPVQQSAPAASSVSGSDAAAKDWIAGRESGGNYGAQNGQYVGKYQLSASYLNGDYSAANQERVADNYVTSRYGSWSGAQSFWQSHGWY